MTPGYRKRGRTFEARKESNLETKQWGDGLKSAGTWVLLLVLIAGPVGTVERPAQDQRGSSDVLRLLETQSLYTSLIQEEREECWRLTFIPAPQHWGLKLGMR